MTVFAQRLLQAMKERNINQKKLSELTGVNKGTLSSYMHGKYTPKQDRLYTIAKALNVDEGWLMGYEVPMKPYDPNEDLDGFELTDEMVVDPEVDKLMKILKITLYRITDDEKRKKALDALRATLDLIK